MKNFISNKSFTVVNKRIKTLLFTTIILFISQNLTFADNYTEIPEMVQKFAYKDNLIIPKRVVNYAKKHNLQLQVDKYYIEKNDVKNGNKYIYIYPCIDRNGNVYAILYKNTFFIKFVKPTSFEIRYLECR